MTEANNSNFPPGIALGKCNLVYKENLSNECGANQDKMKLINFILSGKTWLQCTIV